MLEFSSPLWFLAFLLIPFIWWLHRFGPVGRRIPVAAIILWRGSNPELDPDQARQKPASIWILRALIFGLIVLALTKPTWLFGVKKVLVVWFDNSLSMYTKESGPPRIEKAITELISAIDQNEFDSVRIHLLATPGKGLDLDGREIRNAETRLRQLLEVPGTKLLLPKAALVDRSLANWLITDGVTPDIRLWARKAPLEQIIAVGEETENMAILTLSVRKSLKDRGVQKVLVTIGNSGIAPSKRTLELWFGEDLVHSEEVEIPAEGKQSLTVDFSLDGWSGVEYVKAVLSPHDALEQDDELNLAGAALTQVTVRLVGKCGLALQAALTAFDGIAVVDQGSDKHYMTIDCSGADNFTGAGIIFAAGKNITNIKGPIYWTPAAGSLRSLYLDPTWISPVTESRMSFDWQPILRSNDRVLMAKNKHTKVVNIYFDMENTDFIQRPEYPLLLGGLIQLISGKSPLHEPVAQSIDISAAAVKPVILRPVKYSKEELKESRKAQFDNYLLLTLAFFLLLDLMFVLKRYDYHKSLYSSAG